MGTVCKICLHLAVGTRTAKLDPLPGNKIDYSRHSQKDFIFKGLFYARDNYKVALLVHWLMTSVDATSFNFSYIWGPSFPKISLAFKCKWSPGFKSHFTFRFVDILLLISWGLPLFSLPTCARCSRFSALWLLINWCKDQTLIFTSLLPGKRFP